MGKENVVKDGTHSSPKYVTSGFPLITSKNLNDKGLDMKNVSYISKTDFDKINKRSSVDIGDIILGMIGTIGNPVLLSDTGFAIKNVALIKGNGNIKNKWLLQYLKSPTFYKNINKITAGNTQKFIGLSTIRNLDLRVPLIEEQRKIGVILNVLDTTIASNQLQQKSHESNSIRDQ